MEQPRINRTFISAIATVIALAAPLAARAAVVVGTGNPDLDVPAVQAAVDHGGRVVLKGHFSFNRDPTRPEGSDWRMVTVSNDVVISGTRDEYGDMTTIEGGTIPFSVDALGAHVTFQGLRFVGAKHRAIQVFAVSGLVIAYCRIEGVEPIADPVIEPGGGHLAFGIFVGTTLTGTPTLANPGHPENISGTLLISHNDIDVGEVAPGHTLGIAVFSAGKSPDTGVYLHVSGNNIRNVNERGLDFIKVGGRVHIEHNVITTNATADLATDKDPDVIHAVGSGSYLIAHNAIECRWATGAGIHLQGPPVVGDVITDAVVVDNDVTMSAPEGTVFGENSAGIDIRGFAQGNVVLNNRIRGRARAALAVIAQLQAGVQGNPGNNTFVLNHLEGFQSSLADVFVGPDVTNTLVIGRQATVEDQGIDTRIVGF
jgi:hypothetical protein